MSGKYICFVNQYLSKSEEGSGLWGTFVGWIGRALGRDAIQKKTFSEDFYAYIHNRELVARLLVENQINLDEIGILEEGISAHTNRIRFRGIYLNILAILCAFAFAFFIKSAFWVFTILALFIGVISFTIWLERATNPLWVGKYSDLLLILKSMRSR